MIVRSHVIGGMLGCVEACWRLVLLYWRKAGHSFISVKGKYRYRVSVSSGVNHQLLKMVPNFSELSHLLQCLLFVSTANERMRF